MKKLFESIQQTVEAIGEDIKALYAKVKTIPTKVSQLENDKGYLTADTDTTYKLVLSGNQLKLIESKSRKVISTYDLSVYLDDTTLPKITAGTYTQRTKTITFTRSDDSTFAVNLSSLVNTIPVKTSQLTNDGSDGNHAFVSTSEVPVYDYLKIYNEAKK